MFDVSTSLLRYWENEFDVLQPKKNRKGNRLFTRKDIDNLKLIYHLVKERGFTLEGAKKKLKNNQDSTVRNFQIIEKLKNLKDFLNDLKEDV